MQWCIKIWLAALGLTMILASNSSAGFVFTTIADKNTPIPDGTGNFLGFGDQNLAPVVDAAGEVAFVGYDSNGHRGVYTSINNHLTAVVDGNMTVPGFSTKFTGSIEGFSIDNGRTSFIDGSGTLLAVLTFDTTRRSNPTLQDTQGLQGVYVNQGGTLQKIADLNTAIPGRTNALFDQFANVNTDGNTVAFIGSYLTPSANNSGIYTQTAGGQLTKVLDNDTDIPGIGKLGGFSNLTLRDGNMAFTAGDSQGKEGVYTLIGGIVTKVADGQAVGGITGPLSFDGQHVSFIAGTPNNGNNAVYSNASGSLVKVADTATIYLDGNGNSQTFHEFRNTSIDSTATLFSGGDASNTHWGLFLSQNGSLDSVIQNGDPLDGSTASINDIGLGNYGFNNGFITFESGVLGQNGGGIFLTELSSPPPVSGVPAPPSVVLASLGVLCLAGYAWRRRKTPAIT